MTSDSTPAFEIEKEALKTEIETGIQAGVDHLEAKTAKRKDADKYHNTRHLLKQYRKVAYAIQISEADMNVRMEMEHDDIHTTSAWKILERFTQIPIEHVLIERIKENKSLVDIRLTTGTCREYYQNNVDSFILVSSDSDYWGLISAMPEVRFFVMVESEKCSPTIKNALINAGISYCYIDDFCTGNSNDIKVAAVLREVRQKLDQAFHLNVRDILDEACRATRADMTTAEKNQFYDKYIKTMHVDISPNGEATIVLGK